MFKTWWVTLYFGLPDTRMNILGIFGMAGKCVSFSLWGKIPSLNFSPRIRMVGETRSKSKKMSCNILMMMIFLVLLWILTKVNFLSCGFWGPKSRSGHLDKKEDRQRPPFTPIDSSSNFLVSCDLFYTLFHDFIFVKQDW